MNIIKMCSTPAPAILLVLLFFLPSSFSFFFLYSSLPPPPVSDFIPVNRDILFPANTTSVSVFINITNNEVTESDSESFTISLSNSQNDLSFVTIRRGGGEASVVINDDDSKSTYIV